MPFSICICLWDETWLLPGDLQPLSPMCLEALSKPAVFTRTGWQELGWGLRWALQELPEGGGEESHLKVGHGTSCEECGDWEHGLSACCVVRGVPVEFPCLLWDLGEQTFLNG